MKPEDSITKTLGNKQVGASYPLLPCEKISIQAVPVEKIKGIYTKVRCLAWRLCSDGSIGGTFLLRNAAGNYLQLVVYWFEQTDVWQAVVQDIDNNKAEGFRNMRNLYNFEEKCISVVNFWNEYVNWWTKEQKENGMG